MQLSPNMNNEDLNTATQEKILGVIIDNNLTGIIYGFFSRVKDYISTEHRLQYNKDTFNPA